mmetsp:Transcript_26068/g.34215  ORF Transcript_26068/g.34215 Transcript_26068/m.34215 type:complete len:167 (+) Transcript_26068:56-556(+)|eukprot:CAMPEP_0117798964 /NCGR_PEP_ID=MMETSP0948-20121206/13478_1 /TAXON_ID=44440 /ORGANISM="Chattonella subsalsa, Strain CCMP2191" /LENGTH=166 /DNA_ID=CAMNT_0005630733 /DNA_START=45 /DNA_END=545 /DNA_ORIENTATION=-
MEVRPLVSDENPQGDYSGPVNIIRDNPQGANTANDLSSRNYDPEAEIVSEEQVSGQRTRMIYAASFAVLFAVSIFALILFHGKPPGTCHTDPGCGPLGIKLGGDCCPTKSGEYLSCCSIYNHFQNNSGASVTNQCAAHSKCIAAGLTGLCCPTSSGITLDCCEKDK